MGAFEVMQMHHEHGGTMGEDGSNGEVVVISVGLLGKGKGKERIHPLDKFTLDVFVFNRSSWTRRFEVGCPPRRRRRPGQVDGGAELQKEKDERKKQSSGLLPLDNRVRVG